MHTEQQLTCIINIIEGMIEITPSQNYLDIDRF
jgi:hypothetical protein